jgi:hypothetical protein
LRHHNNIVALVVMASLLSSSWCYHPCHNCIIAIIDAQVSLLLSHWHCHPFALMPLPTLHGHCCLCCAGIVIPIALTSLLLLCTVALYNGSVPSLASGTQSLKLKYHPTRGLPDYSPSIVPTRAIEGCIPPTACLVNRR